MIFGVLEGPDLIIVLVIALLLFGGKSTNVSAASNNAAQTNADTLSSGGHEPCRPAPPRRAAGWPTE